MLKYIAISIIIILYIRYWIKEKSYRKEIKKRESDYRKTPYAIRKGRIVLNNNN